VCRNCGTEYMQRIYTKPDNTETRGDDCCPDCRMQADIASAKDEHEKAMALAAVDVRADWRRAYGVEGKYLSTTFENFKRSWQPKAFDLVSKWQSGSLLLWSVSLYGLGKTHLVCALANKLIAERDAILDRGNGEYLKRPCPVRVENEPELLSRIRATFGKNTDSDEAIYQKLTTVPVLIIDDVGKIRPKELDFTQSVHYRIINTRYVRGLDTIITTNMPLVKKQKSDPETFEEHIGGACADRLREMCGRSGILEMKGVSYRKEAK